MRVLANGIEIAYETVGGGPPLVLLHSATSIARHDFAAQIPLLSKTFRLILPDQRGHGRTRWDVTSGGFEERWLADDLEAFADALGLTTFHLLGFSMGGTAALQFATRLPQRLRTLVICGTSPEREPRTSVARRLMDPARADADPSWKATLAARHDEGQGVDAWRRLLPAIAADIARQPLLSPAQLHAIDVPTLVAVGDRDPFVPAAQATALARQVPNGRLLVVPDCGHEVPAKAPGIFNEAISRFYRTTAAVADRRAAAFQAAHPTEEEVR